MPFIKRISIVFFLCVISFTTLIPFSVFAENSGELSVTPVVIDEKAKARDILKESITLVNKSDHKLTLYPSINSVSSVDGRQDYSAAPTASDEASSLARWIELSRGVIELGPGEERTIQFIIRVNLNATPGAYHALISFSNGSTRDQAEARGSIANVTVNVDVQADIKEVMQLNKFTTDNVVFSGDDVLFKYQLQNIGNQELQPKGEIRIYNRRGEEVASVDINGENKVVSPDQVAQLASVWSAKNGFGKYKALLNVDYGKSQMASVQDSVYFWVVPWKQLLALSIISLITIIFFALYFHRWIEERHLSKLALAGLLKVEAVAHGMTEPQAPIPVPVPEPTVSQPADFAPSRWSNLAFWKHIPPFNPLNMVSMPTLPTIARRHESLQTETPSYVPQQTAPVTASVRSVQHTANDEFRFRPTRDARSQGSTINLKQMCQTQAKEVPTEAHIIDLKKI